MRAPCGCRRAVLACRRKVIYLRERTEEVRTPIESFASERGELATGDFFSRPSYPHSRNQAEVVLSWKIAYLPRPVTARRIDFDLTRKRRTAVLGSLVRRRHSAGAFTEFTSTPPPRVTEKSTRWRHKRIPQIMRDSVDTKTAFDVARRDAADLGLPRREEPVQDHQAWFHPFVLDAADYSVI